MKAIEIVEKLKSVLLSADDTQVEPAAEEQVELAAEETQNVDEIEVKDAVELAEDEEMPAEDSAEEAPEEPKYATKEELESAIAEMRAMYAQIVEKMGSEEMETEVPSEELSKEELSAESPVEPIAHSPEVEEKAKLSFFKQNKPQTTMGVVYEKMFNK